MSTDENLEIPVNFRVGGRLAELLQTLRRLNGNAKTSEYIRGLIILEAYRNKLPVENVSFPPWIVGKKLQSVLQEQSIATADVEKEVTTTVDAEKELEKEQEGLKRFRSRRPKRQFGGGDAE